MGFFYLHLSVALNITIRLHPLLHNGLNGVLLDTLVGEEFELPGVYNADWF